MLNIINKILEYHHILITWNYEHCCMRVLAGNVSEELHVVPVPLDAVQAGLLHVQLEVAEELHHVAHLHHGRQLQLIIKADTQNI